jgi:hypothetical protein
MMMNFSYRQSVTYYIACMLILAFAGLITSCYWDDVYGKPTVVERTIVTEQYTGPEYFNDIKPILDSRCVVCHGCYDAPCQLKLSSIESIDRGASKNQVYDGTRLLAANLTRLSIDSGSTKEWREKDFFPVLNERKQVPEVNKKGSVMYRMLQLKHQNPLPEGDVLDDTFDFSLNRKQQCSKIEEFNDFEKKYPLWGMPYGLPAIEDDKRRMLENWIASGSKANFKGKFASVSQSKLDLWESFLNGSSLKQQLISRYIFEHLFLANFYFEDTRYKIGDEREFFRLVRSKTPPGKAIVNISARRPFEDPKGEFYYRLQRVKSTILAKQHMPYLLNKQRMERWRELFFDVDFSVTTLPSYKPEKASNPFITFAQLPVKSRYKFMLDEAQFTIMGFIKGPVCRGQVALNVIHDHFWVLFMDPDNDINYENSTFLNKQAQKLDLPAAQESNAILLISSWLKYSKLEKQYMRAKEKLFNKTFNDKSMINLSLIWDGDSQNKNAALTVYRHFDSSSVIKGLSGDVPKTAWVIDYPLLERLHYLLVAGFDVYGNVGHQLLTRLYMDFLRMEGEYGFLRFLPKNIAQQELDFWYRGAESNVKLYLQELSNRNYQDIGINFKTDNPKREFFSLIRDKLGEQVIPSDPINDRFSSGAKNEYQLTLQNLSKLRGLPLEPLSEQSLIKLTLKSGEIKLISMIRNKAHSNVSHLFGESQRLIPEEQTLSIVEGVIGSYPNTFYDLREEDLTDFVAEVAHLNSEEDYSNLLAKYAVRRTDQNFWSFSDSIHEWYLQNSPVEAGLLDYNRIENR